MTYGPSKVEMVLPQLTAFDGLTEKYNEFMQDIAGVMRIPVRLLTGTRGATYATECALDAQVYQRMIVSMLDRSFAPLRRHLAWVHSRVNRAMLYKSRRVKPWKHKGRRMTL